MIFMSMYGKKSLLCCVITIGLLMPVAQAQEEEETMPDNAYAYSFDTLEGTALPLSQYEGKVLLVVNTASQCSFTPQYKDLQTVYETYQDQGLVVLAVPSGDFAGQEFEQAEEVQNFTQEHFNITFQLTDISSVSGKEAHPFYQWTNKHAGLFGSPKWNFHKYLIDKEGNFVTWFSSMTSPTSAKVTDAIEKALAE